MLKLFLSIILYFCLSICQAQHLLVFENLKNGKLLAYKLPSEAICTFNDGTKKNVIIDSIQGDSVYCKLRKDNSVVCFSLSAIKKINNSYSEMNKLLLKLGIITPSTIALLGGSLYGIYYVTSGKLYSELWYLVYIPVALASPFTIALTIYEIYLGVKFFYTVSFDKWKFYGIKVK